MLIGDYHLQKEELYNMKEESVTKKYVQKVDLNTIDDINFPVVINRTRNYLFYSNMMYGHPFMAAISKMKFIVAGLYDYNKPETKGNSITVLFKTSKEFPFNDKVRNFPQVKLVYVYLGTLEEGLVAVTIDLYKHLFNPNPVIRFTKGEYSKIYKNPGFLQTESSMPYFNSIKEFIYDICTRSIILRELMEKELRLMEGSLDENVELDQKPNLLHEVFNYKLKSK